MQEKNALGAKYFSFRQLRFRTVGAPAPRTPRGCSPTLERPRSGQRADVPGAQAPRPPYRTRRLPGRIPRIQNAVSHQGSSRALPRLVRPLRQRRLNPSPPRSVSEIGRLAEGWGVIQFLVTRLPGLSSRKRPVIVKAVIKCDTHGASAQSRSGWCLVPITWSRGSMFFSFAFCPAVVRTCDRI